MPPGDEPRAYGASDLTYSKYLELDALLDLQHPQSEPPHHDEMLFIVIHQAFELWFKLVLHELDTAIRYMQQGQVLRARHFVHRVVEVLELFTDQIHILETMEPSEFLQFRGRLAPASGFQSVQFRELEYVLGLKDEAYLNFHDARPEHRATLERRLEQPDLREAYYELLRDQGLDVPANLSPDHLDEHPDEADRLLQALRPLYEDLDDHLPLHLLTESLMDLDEALMLWRQHHVRVVERIIGKKRGTGGSSGVAYLERTTTKRAFPYLWQVRTHLEA